MQAYLCPAGVWTIGYGTTQGVKQGMKITQEKAEELLIKECERFYNGVLAKVGNICNENQIGALVCFSYNVGLGAFESSTLLKKIKAKGTNKEIEKQFMRWVFADGKVLRGLENRRKAEVGLYFKQP